MYLLGVLSISTEVHWDTAFYRAPVVAENQRFFVLVLPWPLAVFKFLYVFLLPLCSFVIFKTIQRNVYFALVFVQYKALILILDGTY